MANYETKALGGLEIWQMMSQPGKLNNNEEIAYGFGISIDSNQGLESIGHGGSWAGNLCQLSYYPKQKITTILMINRDPAGFDFDTPQIISILMGNDEQENAKNEQPPEKTETEVNPKLLAEYVGPYQSSSGSLMWAEQKDDQLIIVSPSGQRVLINPEAKDIFFGKGFDIRFSFLRGEDGTVNQFVYFTGGNESGPFHKLNERAYQLDDMNAFCGDYYCPELRAIYNIAVKNNRLVLEHLHNEDILLQQVAQDCYRGNQWWCTEIKITRDTNSQITGFRLKADSNNIQNLRFIFLPYI